MWSCLHLNLLSNRPYSNVSLVDLVSFSLRNAVQSWVLLITAMLHHCNVPPEWQKQLAWQRGDR